MSGRRLTASQVAGVRELLMKKQNYKCALCEVDFREQTMKGRKRVNKYVPALDHCHTTGYVRAVLCKNCNGKEGEIFNRATSCKRDGTALDFLKKLVAYLELHSTPQTQYIHPMHKTEEQKREARNAKARKARAQAKAKAMLAGK